MPRKRTTLSAAETDAALARIAEAEAAAAVAGGADDGADRSKAFLSKFPTLESLLTSKEGAGLTTATPLQRAICRIIDNKPLEELADNQDVADALGISLAELKTLRFKSRVPEIIIVAAVRCAKSLIAACVALMASQTCELKGLLGGEIPRYPIVSVSVDNARVVVGHLLAMLQMPALRHLRVKQSELEGWQEQWKEVLDETTDTSVVGSMFVWHPSGRPIEIRVVAGRRAGSSVISRWLIGLLLDEAPRMVGADQGVVNYDDTKRGARTRLLPGAQILSIGSPWLPMGPVFSAVTKYHGKPSNKRIVIRARGDKLNPFWWTPERIEEIKTEDPIAYATDFLAEFSDLGESMFPMALLDKWSRKDQGDIEAEYGREYAAAIDPATHRNAWTLVVADRKGEKKRIVFAKQWIPEDGMPLVPKEVLKECAEILTRYHLSWCYTDQWSAEALKNVAEFYNLALIVEEWTMMSKIEAFQSLATELAGGTIEIPDDSVIKQDLNLTRRKATARGQVSIHFASTPDGRHCDYAPPIARVFKKWLNDKAPKQKEPGDEGYLDEHMAKLEAQEAATLKQQQEEELNDAIQNDLDAAIDRVLGRA